MSKHDKPDKQTLPYLTKDDARAIADALNHVWEEVFDRQREADVLIRVTRHLAKAYDLEKRY